MNKVTMLALAAAVGCNDGAGLDQEGDNLQDQGADLSGSPVGTGPGTPEWSSQPLPPGEYDMTIGAVTQACDDFVVVGGTSVEEAFWDSDAGKVLLFGIAPIEFAGASFTATGEGYRLVGDACEVTDTLSITGVKDPATRSFAASVSEVRTSAGTCTAEDLAQVCDNEYDADFSYIEPGDTGWTAPTLVPGEYTMTIQQVVEPCDDYVIMGAEVARPMMFDPDTGVLSLMGMAPIVFDGDGFTATGEGHRTVGAECEVTDTLSFTGYLSGSDTSFEASVVELRTTAGTCTADDLAQICDNRYEASFVFNPMADVPL